MACPSFLLLSRSLTTLQKVSKYKLEFMNLAYRDTCPWVTLSEVVTNSAQRLLPWQQSEDINCVVGKIKRFHFK